MTDPINTPPRPSNPEDTASKPSSGTAARTSPSDADATGPVPAVAAAPPGLESVTGEAGYTTHRAADSETSGTTDRTRSGSPSTAQPSAGQSSSEQGTSEQAQAAAQHVVGDAKNAGRAMKDTAAQEAAGVKDDAVREAKRLGGEASTMLESQATEQLDRAAGTVRTFSDDVARIARGEQPEPGVAKDLVDQLNSRVEATATWLEDHDPKEVLQEVQSFARHRPVAFLAIAAGVGFAAGRLTRGLSQNHSDDAQQDAPASSGGSPTPAGTASGAALGPASGTAAGTPSGPVPGTIPAGTDSAGYPGGTDPYAGGGGR